MARRKLILVVGAIIFFLVIFLLGKNTDKRILGKQPNPNQNSHTEIFKHHKKHHKKEKHKKKHHKKKKKIDKFKEISEEEEQEGDHPIHHTKNSRESIQIPIHTESVKINNKRAKKRQRAIKKAFQHCWNGYREKAWGKDELKPVSGESKNWVPGGMALTLIDSLDTLFIMDMHEEFEEATEFVRTKLSFDKNSGVSVFETNIRVLGGLLSAYDLSGDVIFKEKAKDMGDRLLPAFHTNTGIPYTTINLHTHVKSQPTWNGQRSILSEFGTTYLEFTKLSQITGDPKYKAAVMKMHKSILESMKNNPRVVKGGGLLPVNFHPESGQWSGNHYTFGAFGDSYYEYLLKSWILEGKTNEMFKDLYDKSMRAMLEELWKKSSDGFWFIAEHKNGAIYRKMDHLVCFMGGLLALGHKDQEDPKEKKRHLFAAKELTRTCNAMYSKQASGLSPEVVMFYPGKPMSVGAPSYLMRPEALESMFYLFRITGEQKYRDWGWRIFKAIKKNCLVKYGYSGLHSVTSRTPSHDNFMQSFFLSETLKYLYLLFSPNDLVNIDEWVFNTEAHPLKIKRI